MSPAGTVTPVGTSSSRLDQRHHGHADADVHHADPDTDVHHDADTPRRPRRRRPHADPDADVHDHPQPDTQPDGRPGTAGLQQYLDDDRGLADAHPAGTGLDAAQGRAGSPRRNYRRNKKKQSSLDTFWSNVRTSLGIK